MVGGEEKKKRELISEKEYGKEDCSQRGSWGEHSTIREIELITLRRGGGGGRSTGEKEGKKLIFMVGLCVWVGGWGLLRGKREESLLKDRINKVNFLPNRLRGLESIGERS